MSHQQTPARPGVDSESWTCAQCHGRFIANRPAGDTCPNCLVLQVTTEPPAYAAVHIASGLDVTQYDDWASIRVADVLLVVATPEQAAELKKAAARIEKRLRQAECDRAAIARRDVNEAAAAEAAEVKCPDGGTCHHECARPAEPCFRVMTCGPLSGVYPGDDWPAEVIEEARAALNAERSDDDQDAEAVATLAATGLARPQESALPSPAEVTARAIAPRFSGDDDTCGAIDPDPQGDWVCTSYLGHGDDHGAWTRDGVLAHSWPQAVACRHCGEPIEKCDHGDETFAETADADAMGAEVRELVNEAADEIERQILGDTSEWKPTGIVEAIAEASAAVIEDVPQSAAATLAATLAATGLARPPGELGRLAAERVCVGYGTARMLVEIADRLAALAASEAVADARVFLDRIDRLWMATDGGLAVDERPLSGALRAVLAEIDKAAGA